jgi:hydrogenase maturation factor
MHLHYGEIVDVLEEEGVPIGKLRVGRSVKKVPIGLLTDPQPGDRVLVCDGVAISKVEEEGHQR